MIRLCLACLHTSTAMYSLFQKQSVMLLWAHAARAGAQLNVHSERKPQRFQAVVSGMDATSVAAERHFSPRKVAPGLASALLNLFVSCSITIFMPEWSCCRKGHAAGQGSCISDVAV